MKTDSLDALFIETPVKKVGRVKQGRVPFIKPKPVKRPKNVLEGVSSWAILRELLSRHYVDLQVVGFWLGLAIIIWVKLGR